MNDELASGDNDKTGSTAMCFPEDAPPRIVEGGISKDSCPLFQLECVPILFSPVNMITVHPVLIVALPNQFVPFLLSCLSQNAWHLRAVQDAYQVPGLYTIWCQTEASALTM